MRLKKIIDAFRTRPIRDTGDGNLLSAAETKEIERKFARGNILLHEGDYVTIEEVRELRKKVLPRHARTK